MKNILLIAILLLILGLAAFYIIREKKRGAKCIGCPHSRTCRAHGGTCGNHKEN